jgi:hypothetical protein
MLCAREKTAQKQSKTIDKNISHKLRVTRATATLKNVFLMRKPKQLNVLLERREANVCGDLCDAMIVMAMVD